jgi:hypothetical protein
MVLGFSGKVNSSPMYLWLAFKSTLHLASQALALLRLSRLRRFAQTIPKNPNGSALDFFSSVPSTYSKLIPNLDLNNATVNFLEAMFLYLSLKKMFYFFIFFQVFIGISLFS